MTAKLANYLIVLLILALFGLLGINASEIATRREGQFFGVLPSREQVELSPLQRPEVSLKALLNWATLAATAALTLNFVHYEQTLEDLRIYFTEDGYDSFLAALQSSGNLNTILEKKLIVTAVATGPAIVAGEDEEGSFHSWTIQVPVSVSYLSASEEQKRQKVIVLDITQIPTTENPRGIGIKKYTEEAPAIE